MEVRVLNINLVYIYPKTIEINNEMNLLRIVDKIEKESLVIYYIKENEKYKIYMINTSTGENTYIISYDEKKIDNFIGIIQDMEIDIKSLENLKDIEKYILKSIKN